MENDSLVAINIYNKDTKELYNNKETPILYYWNGDGDLLQCILNDKQFKDNYISKINNIDIYCNMKMSYFYFCYDEDNNEQYVDNSVLLSDYISLNSFDSYSIVLKIIINHLYDLYSKAFNGKSYEKLNVFNEDIIIDIYDEIKNKYKERLLKNTLINWVRSEISKKEKLNEENENYIIDTLTNILKNKE